MKLPSPFIFTVRAATDCVKAYRRHFAGVSVPGGVCQLFAIDQFVLTPEPSCTGEYEFARMAASVNAE